MGDSTLGEGIVLIEEEVELGGVVVVLELLDFEQFQTRVFLLTLVVCKSVEHAEE
jgi:hypothetical protein